MRDHEETESAEAEVHLGPLADSLGFLLRLSQLRSFRDFFASLGHLDVRPGEVSVLMAIAENPGIRQGLLARKLMIKRAHMTKMVQAMEEAGLVRRAVSETDRRAVDLSLTEKGEVRVSRLRGPFLDHEARATPGLTDAEDAELKRLLRKFLGLRGEDEGERAR